MIRSWVFWLFFLLRKKNIPTHDQFFGKLFLDSLCKQTAFTKRGLALFELISRAKRLKLVQTPEFTVPLIVTPQKPHIVQELAATSG